MAVRGKNFRHSVGGRPLYGAFWKSTAIVKVQVVKNEIYLKLWHSLKFVVADLSSDTQAFVVISRFYRHGGLLQGPTVAVSP